MFYLINREYFHFQIPCLVQANWHEIIRSREVLLSCSLILKMLSTCIDNDQLMCFIEQVKQSWLTTIVTTLLSLADSFLLVLKIRPELIICNGPGTCVPLCITAFGLRLWFGMWYSPKIIFIESICRVKSFSLSGKILYHIVDKFIVQWPLSAAMARKYARAEYLGDF